MENNQLQLVTFEQAQRLKKLGFDYPTTCFYVDIEDSEPKTAFPFYEANRSAFAQEPMNWNMWQTGGEFCNTSAPTVSLALKWMRDVKGIALGIYFEKPHIEYQGCATLPDDFAIETSWYDSHEQAESALLDELLTLIEK